MPVEYVSVEEAIARDGVRMVVVSGVPSPWGEAAKGMFHIKSIPYVAVRLERISQLRSCKSAVCNHFCVWFDGDPDF